MLSWFTHLLEWRNWQTRGTSNLAHETEQGTETPSSASLPAHCAPPAARETRHWIARVQQSKPLPLGYEAIAERVEEVISQAVEDLGGPSELTSQQRVVLETERVALLILGLGEAYLRRFGLVDRRQRPRNILRVLAPYLNAARCAASVLGLARVPRKVESLEDVIAEIAAEKAAKESPDAK